MATTRTGSDRLSLQSVSRPSFYRRALPRTVLASARLDATRKRVRATGGGGLSHEFLLSSIFFDRGVNHRRSFPAENRVGGGMREKGVRPIRHLK